MTVPEDPGPASTGGSGVSLHLMHGPFLLVDGARHPIPRDGERLLVLVALRGPVRRRAAARLLWPEADPARAAGNLRSALWRLGASGFGSDGIALVDERGDSLDLDRRVAVDLPLLCARAGELVAGRVQADDLAQLPQVSGALHLLPGWYDDWVAAERERVRSLMLDAIDALSVRLGRAGRGAEAIDAALVAVGADPLRESSQRQLMVAHLGEGNLYEARRAFGRYRELLRTDLGLEPPTYLSRMLELPSP